MQSKNNPNILGIAAKINNPDISFVVCCHLLLNYLVTLCIKPFFCVCRQFIKKFKKIAKGSEKSFLVSFICRYEKIVSR